MTKKAKAPRITRKKQIARLHHFFESSNPHKVQVPTSVLKPLLTMEQAKLLLTMSQCCGYVDPEYVLKGMHPNKTINHPRYGQVDLFDLRMIIDQLLGMAFVMNGRKKVAEVQQ